MSSLRISPKNIIGSIVGRLRYERGWTQEQLVARIQLAGRYMTRDIVTNIENRRSAVTDVQIAALADAFGVHAGDLFSQCSSLKRGSKGFTNAPTVTKPVQFLGRWPLQGAGDIRH